MHTIRTESTTKQNSPIHFVIYYCVIFSYFPAKHLIYIVNVWGRWYFMTLEQHVHLYSASPRVSCIHALMPEMLRHFR